MNNRIVNDMNEQDSVPYIPETIGDFLERGGVKNPHVFSLDMDILEAVRKMNTNGFSQVPVCTTDGRLEAYLSWDGIFRGISRNPDSFAGVVSDYCCRTLDTKIISLDAPTREALHRLQTNEFLIIVDSLSGLKVKGLITVSDLSALYSTILQGFTLINDIETRLRIVMSTADVRLIELQKLSKNEELQSVSGLTLGQFSFIMNNERVWPRLSISRSLDRISFHELLSRVTEIRNKIMHNNWIGSQNVNVSDDLMELESFFNLLSANM